MTLPGQRAVDDWWWVFDTGVPSSRTKSMGDWTRPGAGFVAVHDRRRTQSAPAAMQKFEASSGARPTRERGSLSTSTQGSYMHVHVDENNHERIGDLLDTIENIGEDPFLLHAAGVPYGALEDVLPGVEFQAEIAARQRDEEMAAHWLYVEANGFPSAWPQGSKQHGATAGAALPCRPIRQ